MDPQSIISIVDEVVGYVSSIESAKGDGLSGLEAERFTGILNNVGPRDLWQDGEDALTLPPPLSVRYARSGGGSGSISTKQGVAEMLPGPRKDEKLNATPRHAKPFPLPYQVHFR